MRSVTKEFTFDTGHRLSNYEGKCKHLHGHTYRLLVTFGATDLDEKGMVIDFGVLKEIFKTHIEPLYDHKILLKKGDPINEAIAKALDLTEGEGVTHKAHITWMMDNPTAENIASDIFNSFQQCLKHYQKGDRLWVDKVVLYETPTSYATVEACACMDEQVTVQPSDLTVDSDTFPKELIGLGKVILYDEIKKMDEKDIEKIAEKISEKTTKW